MEGQPPLYDDVYGFVFQSICLNMSLCLVQPLSLLRRQLS